MRTFILILSLVFSILVFADDHSSADCTKASLKSTETVAQMAMAIKNCNDYPSDYYREVLNQQFTSMKNDNDIAKKKCERARDLGPLSSNEMSEIRYKIGQCNRLDVLIARLGTVISKISYCR